MNKTLKYWLYDYWEILLTALFSIGLQVCTYSFINNPFMVLFLSTIIIVLSVIIIIAFRLKEKKLYFTSLKRIKHKYDWFGVGRFEYLRTDKCYEITNSERGYIYSKCLDWFNYDIMFDFNITDACLGVILRGENLSNYVMLQISVQDDDNQRIRPHIRINGVWQVTEENKYKMRNRISLNSWYSCNIKCDRDRINIKISQNGKEVNSFSMEVPRGEFSVYNHKEHRTVGPPLPINYDFGSIGFRNDRTERALVKDLRVKKL